MTTILRIASASTALGLILAALVAAGDPPQYRVVVKDAAAVAQEAYLPIDPQVRINPQFSGNGYFGLMVDNSDNVLAVGQRLAGGAIDGVIHNPVNANMQLQMKPLPKAGNKVRHGTISSWNLGQLEFTQTVEVAPSKPVAAAAGAKRRLDTVRVSYVIENKDKVAHEIAFRANLDIMINNNDGALFASPTTHPGQVLNGVALEGKTLPAFFQVLEQPNVQNPGFAAVMTLKSGGKAEGPNKAVLTQLGAVGGGAWDVPAVPAGDSACALFWEKKILKPGEKRELTWAYGGGIASDPESDGKVTLSLGGNLEPGKLFTLSALVEDPVSSQTLAIELPPGIERIEGAEIQPVPAAGGSGASLVLWKGRVTRPGAFDIRVRSSTGVMHTKSVSIEAIERR